MESLTQVQILDLSHNEISVIELKAFQSLKQLKNLDLSHKLYHIWNLCT